MDVVNVRLEDGQDRSRDLRVKCFETMPAVDHREREERPAVGKRRAGRKAGTGDPWTAGGQYNHKRMGVAGIADKGASWFVLRLGVRELATESGGCGSGMGSVIN